MKYSRAFLVICCFLTVLITQEVYAQDQPSKKEMYEQQKQQEIVQLKADLEQLDVDTAAFKLKKEKLTATKNSGKISAEQLKTELKKLEKEAAVLAERRKKLQQRLELLKSKKQ